MEPIDDVAVQRGMDGLTRLTHAEIREAILRMTWKKYSAREIASRLGITPWATTYRLKKAISMGFVERASQGRYRVVGEVAAL